MVVAPRIELFIDLLELREVPLPELLGSGDLPPGLHQTSLRELIEHHDRIGVQYSTYLKKVHERLAKAKKVVGEKLVTVGAAVPRTAN